MTVAMASDDVLMLAQTVLQMPSVAMTRPTPHFPWGSKYTNSTYFGLFGASGFYACADQFLSGSRRGRLDAPD